MPPRRSTSSTRAIRRDWPSDNVIVQRDAAGAIHYFRRDDDAHEEYTCRKPFILELEITRRCNLRCIHCYAEAQDRAFPDELTACEIRRVLDDGREIGIRELSLTGGEVFLRDDFFRIIDDGLARGYAVRFVTNGTLLDDWRLTELCRRPIKMITVSLDSISPAVHERIRGPHSHAPATRAIERLREAGFHVSVITAFSKLNVGDFDALLEFCTARRIDWQVQITSAKGRCPAPITLTPDEYYALGEKVAAAMAARPPMNIIPMDDLATFSHFAPLSILSQTWQGRCSGGMLNLFVRANGDVTPCSALCFAECIVGNVRRDSLAAICREERCARALDWVRAENMTGVCASCCFKDACQGGCPEILLSMCHSRTENEYCYHRIEQERVVHEALGDA
ncbi:MAG: radical SAM protein [Phycisphaerae bacterium]